MMARTVTALGKAGRDGTTRADPLFVFLAYFKAFTNTPTELKYPVLTRSVRCVTGIAHTFVSVPLNLIFTTAL